MTEQPPRGEAPDDEQRLAEPDAGPARPMLIFRAGSLWMAADAEQVVEIRGAEPATPVPLAPAHVEGIINLRGQAVPLLDLGGFLGLPAVEVAEEAREEAGGFFDRTVIVAVSGMRVGLLCDQVRGVYQIPDATMRQPEVIQGDKLLGYAEAEAEWGGEVLLVLNLARLLEGARVPE